jgi:hypothetical protein
MFLYVAVVGYMTDASGNAKVEYDLQIITPSGAIDEDLTHLPALNFKIVNPQAVQLASTVIKFVATPKYEPGEYTFKVTVRDLLAGSDCRTSCTCNLVHFELDTTSWTDEESNLWISSYQLDPSPFKAGHAFFSFAHGEYPENAFVPLFAFFVELYGHNKWQVPYLLERFHGASTSVKTHTGWLIKQLGLTDTISLEGLTSDERDFITALAPPSVPVVDDRITEASQLDWLWGTFHASGTIEPIRKLASALELRKYESNLKKWKAENARRGTTATPDKEVMLGVTYYAAQWSIGSNCKQSELVRAYCRHLIEQDSLGTEAREALKSLLEP